MTFSPNIPNIERSKLCMMLGMVNSSLEEKYLGVSAIFAYIKDKVWRRLCGWNRKLLSHTRKEIFLTVIAQAILSFVMSVFLLLTSLYMELERMMCKIFIMWALLIELNQINLV